jgi:FMN phosphatase YigB (HAD superfamily)
MSRKLIDTVILDLDNTLFDWFALWYAWFRPLYDEIIKATGKSAADVEADIRKVHQAYRTSEFTFLLEEIECLAEWRARGDIRQQFSEAIDLSRQGRDHHLKLYPGVLPSLSELKTRGTRIVAYTESMEFYSAYRLKRLGLDGVIDILFSPEDHVVPPGISLDKLRGLSDESDKLQVTDVRCTPPGELKPNPRVLLDIIKDVGISIERCAYIGDSLFKDVAMARDVGVLDIHARYGESQRRSEYALLQRVSHWTAADVERERTIIAEGHDLTPTVVLEDSFAEVFRHCEFVPCSTRETTIAAEQGEQERR